MGTGTKEDGDTQTISQEKRATKEPPLFKVILLNDDYTTMEFVVDILETIFDKTPAEAVQIMMRVHRQGRGVCGTFAKQIAEAKQCLVHERARADGFPLRCILEAA